MTQPKKKRSFLNRLITVILIIIIIVSGAMLVPELYQLYTEWKLRHQYDAVVSQKIDDEIVINPDWEKLQAMNPDIKGWIAIPNTPINYPILQGPDNDYYLYRASNKENNKFGSIFLDASANPNFTDDNTIVYGHNVMGYKGMFSKLTDFLKPDFFDANPVFYILTPEQKFECNVMSVNKVLDTANSYQTNFTSPQQVINLVNENKQTAELSRDVEFRAGDNMVTLSTCDLNYGLESEHRIILSAKLVPYDGEVKLHIT